MKKIMKRISKSAKQIKNSKIAVLSNGAIIEDLPYPHVYYPCHYGTFFVFAKDKDNGFAFCSCERQAVENYIKLKERREHIPECVYPLRMTFFDSWFFPTVVSEMSLKYEKDTINHIEFVDGLCHRCNKKTPYMNYCHEMYGSLFVQQYGWYINQDYFSLGIYPMSYEFLDDVCPVELQRDIIMLKHLNKSYAENIGATYRLKEGSEQEDFEMKRDKHNHINNELQKEIRRQSTTIKQKVENITRKDFGFRKVGDQWVSETILYNLINEIYPEHEIIRHFRPSWLEGLELDIFIPKLKLAFEYQGEQHYVPLKIWGDKGDLKRRQERDARKALLCKQQNVKLIEISYTEPLNLDYLRKKIARQF